MSISDAELEFFVAAGAEDRIGAVLATAEVGGFGLIGLELDGRESGALVTAVAEGLASAQSAGTPVIALAGLDFDGIGTLLGNGWFWHGEILLDTWYRYYRLLRRLVLRIAGRLPRLRALLQHLLLHLLRRERWPAR